MRVVSFLVLLAVTLLPAAGASAQNAADKQTARQISDHLKHSGQLQNYRIGVTCQDGVVSLSGTVASGEQRDAAIRLAEQVSGVSHVVSRLEYPGADAAAAEPGRSMSNAFGDERPAAGTDGRSGVVQAYGDNGAVPGAQAERSPMLARTTSPQRGARQMPRSNMPLPAPRGAMRPAIQQASAQGVYPAGGGCPPGYGGGQMGGQMGGPMGGQMGGPMMGGGGGMGPQVAPVGYVPHAHGRGPSYENAQMPGYAWPSYASYPNYGALSYPRQYSPTAWPYIGPFYPYPQVPLAWRKVSLEWDDGWWFLDFSAHNSSH